MQPRFAKRKLPVAFLGLCLGFSACTKGKTNGELAKGVSSAPALSSDPFKSLEKAEWIRNRAGIGAPLAGKRDAPEVRRRAAQALGRMDDPAALADLRRLLSDEAPGVVFAAAHGIGRMCSEGQAQNVTALALAATRWQATKQSAPPASTSANPAASSKKPAASAARNKNPPAKSPKDKSSKEKSSPSARRPGEVAKLPGVSAGDVPGALGRALGRCGSPNAEKILASWLAVAGWEVGASLGLARISRKRRLKDPTQVALIKLATGSPSRAALAEALVPFARGPRPQGSGALVHQLASAASAHAQGGGPYAQLATRVLARVDGKNHLELFQKLTKDVETTPQEVRVEAVGALARLGNEAPNPLISTLEGIFSGYKGAAVTSLVGADFGVMLGGIQRLPATPKPKLRRGLLKVDGLLPKSEASLPLSVRRRLAQLRCGLRAKVARSLNDPLLLQCAGDSPDELAIRQHAQLRVWARMTEPVTLPTPWLEEFFAAKSGSVRARAYELAAGLSPAPKRQSWLLQGLASKNLGDVTAALVGLGKHAPAYRKPGTDSSALGQAVVNLDPKQWPIDALETQVAYLEAIAKLGLKAPEPVIRPFCSGAAQVVRKAAEKALAAVDPKTKPPHCGKASKSPRGAFGADPATASVKALVFHTDAGPMRIRLNRPLASFAVRRLIRLAKQGFFKNMAIHRVVPGFVVQFGDKNGDGTGGASLPPLPCETSPRLFSKSSVGVAIAGRDTGSSQFFITLSVTPHLDGDYTLLGDSSSPWETLAQGDRIRRVELVE